MALVEPLFSLSESSLKVLSATEFFLISLKYRLGKFRVEKTRGRLGSRKVMPAKSDGWRFLESLSCPTASA